MGKNIETEKPEISVVIPTYRRPCLLRESIKSVVNQKIDVPFEIIVVDNEPSRDWAERVDDATIDFVTNNVKVYRNEKNLGMFGNWNKCIEHARGNWITVLNDDDLMMGNCLSTACLMMNEATSNIFVVQNDFFGTKIPKKLDVPYFFRLLKTIKLCVKKSRCRSEVSLFDMYCGMPFRGGLGVFFKKDLAINIGCFNENYYPSADYHFFSNYIKKYGSAYTTTDICAHYRWGENDSLKVETRIGFIEKDYLIRADIVESLPLNCLYKKMFGALNGVLKRVQISQHSYQCQGLDRTQLNTYFETSSRMDKIFNKYIRHIVKVFAFVFWNVAARGK